MPSPSSPSEIEIGLEAFQRGDYNAAFRHLLPAGRNGDRRAQFYLGELYAKGLGVTVDDGEATKWYRRSAEQGWAQAQFELGRRYDFGLGVKHDPIAATAWYRRAADQGLAIAQYLLGINYETGDGVLPNEAEALKWYGMAATQGLASAQLRLGKAYYFAWGGLPKDWLEATKWTRLAAEQELLTAQVFLGDLYYFGRDRRPDYAEAVKWYRRAAARGNVEGQFSLALLYTEGQGVQKDTTEAARLYHAAAEQGHDQAQTNLGVLYYRGDGVLQNHAEAVKWWSRAADQGNGQAQMKLGIAYENGFGVRQDLVLAHMWYNLASVRLTGEDQQAALRFRTKLDPRLTSAQVTRAQQLAAEWKPRRSVGSEPSRAASPRSSESSGRPEDARVASTGTGFIVSGKGHVLTNDHVVEGCGQVRASLGSGVWQQARIIARDPQNDLALLSLGLKTLHVATFRIGRPVRQGDAVVAIGFPLRGLLSAEATMTAGIISAMAGLRNDKRYLQVTAPVQVGNSGGPLLDEAGGVVGVIVGKLDTLLIAEATGDVPQNVNFAINGSVARTFLDKSRVEYETISSSRKIELTEIGERAKKFTVAIECLR